jgi:hypothetical protein
LVVCQKLVSRWIRYSFESGTYFTQMERALMDEYLLRCLTPSRSGVIYPVRRRGDTTLLQSKRSAAKHHARVPATTERQWRDSGHRILSGVKISRQDPRAVAAMARYTVEMRLSLGNIISTGKAVDYQVGSIKAARLLATAIYDSLKAPDASELQPAEVMAIFPKRPDLGSQAWRLLCREGLQVPDIQSASSGRRTAQQQQQGQQGHPRGSSLPSKCVSGIGLSQVRTTVQRVYEARRNLALSLQSANAVVHQLSLVVMWVFRVPWFFWSLWTLGFDMSGIWIAFSSCLVGLTFVFGTVIRELFEAAVYLFICHPYDVGDWLCIGADDGTTTYHQVVHIALSRTLLKNIEGKEAFWNTSVLAKKHPLQNLSRSGLISEQYTIVSATIYIVPMWTQLIVY